VVLSALGERETETGKAKLADNERRQVRRQALGVWVKSGVTGLLCALLVWCVHRMSS
jgi:hypothetical protein